MPRHAKKRLVWVLLGLALLIGFLTWGTPRIGTLQERAYDATGTSGRVPQNVEEGDPEGGPSGIAGGIHELETITGAIDGNELVGRRVDLHVDLAAHPSMIGNASRFWIGNPDNAVLVVLRRDVDSNAPHERGEPRDHGIARIEAGRSYAVSGTIQRIPSAEERYSWELSNADQRMLQQRPIYIRADRVMPE